MLVLFYRSVRTDDFAAAGADSATYLHMCRRAQHCGCRGKEPEGGGTFAIRLASRSAFATSRRALRLFRLASLGSD
eukprot:2484546-Pyramimonas_sp.AAC.1